MKSIIVGSIGVGRTSLCEVVEMSTEKNLKTISEIIEEDRAYKITAPEIISTQQFEFKDGRELRRERRKKERKIKKKLNKV